jgi:tetratricopeptide (TPR) repeat protein
MIIVQIFRRPIVPSMKEPDRDADFAAAVKRADAARDRRNWEIAADEYRGALTKNPEALNLRVQLGHALKESGDYQGALASYTLFLAENSDDVDIHLQIGHLYSRLNDPHSALDWYEKAQALDPTSEDIALHTRRAKENIAKSAEMSKRAPAMRLVRTRRWPEAKAALNELIEREGYSDLIGVLANVCKEAGDFAEAEQNYRRYRTYAAERDPSLLVDVEVQSGHFAKVQGDYWKAVIHFAAAQRALESDALRHRDDALLSELLSEIAFCKQQVCSVFL